MKYIYLVLLLIACNKEDEKNETTCYTCQVGPFNGQPAYYQDICTDRIDTVVFRNAQGQSLGSNCTPK